jgi:hypothetical protein
MDAITVFRGIWAAPVTYLVLPTVETRLYGVTALMSANRNIGKKGEKSYLFSPKYSMTNDSLNITNIIVPFCRK